MSDVFRGIRGAVGVGVAWAVSWATALLVWVGGSTLGAGGGLTLASLSFTASTSAALGFVSGLVFSAAFSVLNHGKALHEISTGQTALLGMAAGVLFPAAFIGLAASAGLAFPMLTVAVNLLIGMTLGGTTSYGLIRIARSGASRIEPMDEFNHFAPPDPFD